MKKEDCWPWNQGATFGVGSKVYTSGDRYRRDTQDEELDVVGETKFSWLVGGTREDPWWKLPKVTDHGRPSRTIKTSNHGFTHTTFYLLKAHLDEVRWVGAHVYRIAKEVERVKDPQTLQQIADLINYPEKKP